MTRISLCVIARDEAAFLAACLESARRVVDETIVVDTGSVDATREIAELCGARVLEHPWDDDFAAARNAGLEAAEGTHVLVLDADEVLAPGAGKALKRAACDPAFLLGLLPLHDADGLDAPPADVVAGRRRKWAPNFVPRFFRNDPRVRFSRRVHETVLAGVQRVLGEEGGKVEVVEAPLVHYGEVADLRRARGKTGRNTRLLERAFEEDPGDGDLAGYLAHEYYRAGELQAAHDVAMAAFEPWLERIRATPPGLLRPSPILLGGALAVCQLHLGRPREALDTATRAAACCDTAHPNLRFLEGVALRRLGRLDEAEACLRDCLALDGRSQLVALNPGVTGGAARLQLGEVLLERGRPAEARELARDLEPPYTLAGALLCAEAELALGEPAQALRRLGPLLAGEQPPPDLFLLAARAAEHLGQPEPTFLDTARSAPATSWVEPRRRALLADAGAPAAATPGS